MYVVLEDNIEAYYAIRLEFQVTNNEVRYEALLVGLAIVRASGESEVDMKTYSQVVVGQIIGEYLAKS